VVARPRGNMITMNSHRNHHIYTNQKQPLNASRFSFCSEIMAKLWFQIKENRSFPVSSFIFVTLQYKSTTHTCQFHSRGHSCWPLEWNMSVPDHSPERCPLCDQEEETVQHILITCVFARQFPCAILQPLNLTRLTPARNVSFADWWEKAERRMQKQHRKGFNSLCILGSWTLRKHRNACVFEGSAPNLQAALQAFKDEAHVWQFAGAKELSTLCL